jgi:hypothetical protein
MTSNTDKFADSICSIIAISRLDKRRHGHVKLRQAGLSTAQLGLMANCGQYC